MTNRNDNVRSLRAVALGVLLVAALPACRGMVSPRPPVHLNPNMDNVTYVGPQEPARFFADGRGMRPQVEGTVAVGELRADTHMYTGLDPDSAQGKPCEIADECAPYRACVDGACRDFATDLPDSMTLDHALVERGRARFGIYCTPCHGDAGLENGGVVPQRAANRGSAWLVPSLHGPRQRGYAVGQIFDIVSHGFNTMPGYAAQVPVEDRWAIATYVRALQVANEMPLAQVPTDVAAEQGWR